MTKAHTNLEMQLRKERARLRSTLTNNPFVNTAYVIRHEKHRTYRKTHAADGTAIKPPRWVGNPMFADKYIGVQQAVAWIGHTHVVQRLSEAIELRITELDRLILENKHASRKTKDNGAVD